MSKDWGGSFDGSHDVSHFALSSRVLTDLRHGGTSVGVLSILGLLEVLLVLGNMLSDKLLYASHGARGAGHRR